MDGAAAGEGLVLTGVTMELAGTPGPATVVTGATVSLWRQGITVVLPSGAPVTVAWADLAGARCGETGVMPDGTPAVAIAALVARRFVRWLVPLPQMGAERAMAIDLMMAGRTGRQPLLADSFTVPDAPVDEPSAAVVVGPAANGGPAGVVVGPAANGGPDAAGVSAPVVDLDALGAGGPAGPPSPGRSRLVVAMWTAVVLLAIVGAAVLAAGLSAPGHKGSAPPPTATSGATLARSVNIGLRDLPAGWSVAATPHGPLSGFVDGGPGAAAIGAGAQAPAIDQRYERCLGIPASRDAVMGTAGPKPITRASSKPFSGPSAAGPMEVVSVTAVFRSGSNLRLGADQITARGFPQCFGAAVGAAFRQSALASSRGVSVTVGQPVVDPVRVPSKAGLRAAGVVVDLPLQFTGATVPVQFGFVFVAGDRVESMLVTFSERTGFPKALTARLAADVERHIAAA